MKILVLNGGEGAPQNLDLFLRGHDVVTADPNDDVLGLFEGERPDCVVIAVASDTETPSQRIADSPWRRQSTVIGVVADARLTKSLQPTVDDFVLEGASKEVWEARLALAECRVAARRERKRAREALEESHANLTALIENLDGYVLFSDAEGFPVLYNSAYAAVMSALLGIEMRPGLKPHTLLDDPEARQVWEDYHRRVLAGESFRAEYPHTQEDGSTRHFEVAYNPVVKDGAVAGFSEFTRDITDRKLTEVALRQARDQLEAKVFERTAELAASNLALQEENRARQATEEALRRSEERYRGVFDTATLAIVLWDTECRVRAWNRHAERLFGWTQEEILGKSFFDFIIPEQARPHVEDVVAALLDGQLPSRSLNDNCTKDGEIILCEWNNVARYDSAGHVIGAVSLGLDITEQRRMEERLRMAEKLEAIGQLAGGVAHDFNNQLVGVMGNADLLAASLDDPLLRSYAEKIVEAAAHSAELISQLLAFARRNPLRSAPVDLHATIGDVVTLLERSIDKRIVIDLDLRAEPAITSGDPIQLENALLNLALNARDAMHEGGVLSFRTDVVSADELPPAERAEGAEAAGFVRVRVRDTGAGMDAETRSHLFEPFFTTKETGTGMGLAAVYGTIRSHHGVIHVTSEPGLGSEFELYLPLVEPTADPEAEQPEAAVSSVSATILLVDDEQTVLKPAAEMLAMLGHRVIACQDGEEAIERYREDWQAIDLVIMDVVMPKLSGPEIHETLRQINPAVAVLLTSGYNSHQAFHGAERSESVSFLQKPYRLSTLADAVQAMLGD